MNPELCGPAQALSGDLEVSRHHGLVFLSIMQGDQGMQKPCTLNLETSKHKVPLWPGFSANTAVRLYYSHIVNHTLFAHCCHSYAST